MIQEQNTASEIYYLSSAQLEENIRVLLKPNAIDVLATDNKEGLPLADVIAKHLGFTDSAHVVEYLVGYTQLGKNRSLHNEFSDDPRLFLETLADDLSGLGLHGWVEYGQYNSFSFSVEQLVTMMHMQNRLNRNLNEGWLSAGYDWGRAIRQEASEAIDYLPWKWWKKTTFDKEQFSLEIVDKIHFLLSQILVDEAGKFVSNFHRQPTEKDVANIIAAAGYNYSKFTGVNRRNFDPRHRTFQDILYILERIAQTHSPADPPSTLEALLNIMAIIGFTPEELTRIYVSKNALNLFRMNNGYRAGEYIKIWNGREDNVVLSEITEELRLVEFIEPPVNYYAWLEEMITLELTKRYQALTQ